MAKTITLEMIKQLRDETQVGMMDCKNALISADGDYEKAIEILRKKGAAVAAKRAEKATNHGTIATYISPDYTTGALLEVSCETDFAANTIDMRTFAATVSEQIVNTSGCCGTECSIECLAEQPLFNNPKKTVKGLLDELIAKISENIKITRYARFSNKDGLINAYIHPGSTLGIMIELETKNLTQDKKATVAQLAKDLCMQIAVFTPICVEPSQVDPTLLEKEKEIIKEQLKASGKPEAMLEKILVGKLSKYYEDVCLTKQKYIKDDKVSVEQYVEKIGKETGSTIKIKQYKRFATGK